MKKVIWAESVVIVILCFFLYGKYSYDESVISEKRPTHVVHMSTTVKAIDKSSIHKSEVPKEVLKNPNKEVVAIGKIKTSDGTYNIAAPLDKKTGIIEITSKKSFAEFLFSHELGIGYGINIDEKGINIIKQAYYRNTLGRIGPVYGTILFDYRDIYIKNIAIIGQLSIKF